MTLSPPSHPFLHLLFLLLPFLPSCVCQCGYVQRLGDGNVTLIQFEDQSRVIYLHDIFPDNVTLSEYQRVLDAYGQSEVDPDTGVFIRYHPYTSLLVLTTRGKTVLVDSGPPIDGNTYFDDTETDLLTQMQQHGVEPERIDYVVHTHLHRDHTGWDMTEAGEGGGAVVPQFVNAKYVVQRDELAYWNATSENRQRVNYDQMIRPLVEGGVMIVVEGTHWITEEVMVFPCPGHTPGHQCVLIVGSAGNGSETAIHVGDAFHKPAQVQVPLWGSKFDVDPSVAVQTRRELIQNVTQRGSLLIVGHFPFPGIGKLQSSTRSPSGFIFVPVFNTTDGHACPVSDLPFTQTARFYVIISIVIVLVLAAIISGVWILKDRAKERMRSQSV